jgi:hypothetical protein
LLSVAVALSPALLGWGLSPVNCNLKIPTKKENEVFPMKYDFTTVMDRRGRDALAVDALGQGWAPAAPREGFDAIPMWVADMNFPTVPTVCAAIADAKKRLISGK